LEQNQNRLSTINFELDSSQFSSCQSRLIVHGTSGSDYIVNATLMAKINNYLTDPKAAGIVVFNY